MATGIENLRIYNEARELEIKVHDLTSKFPADEKFKMVDQMRRASASVSNNIAEGYGKYNFGEKIHSFQIARGEAYEIRNQVLSSEDKKYLNGEFAEDLLTKYTDLIKGISSYISFLKSKKEKLTI